MSNPPPAPTRSDRKACWASRDEFFRCLNSNNVNTPPEFAKRGEGPCAREREEYEKHCAKSWVEYFNKRRVLEIRQQAAHDAAEQDRNARDQAFNEKRR